MALPTRPDGFKPNRPEGLNPTASTTPTEAVQAPVEPVETVVAPEPVSVQTEEINLVEAFPAPVEVDIALDDDLPQVVLDELIEEAIEEVEEDDEDTPSDEDLADEFDAFAPEDFEAARNLIALLNDNTSSEILMNGPTAIMYKRNGARIHADNVKFSSVEAYHQFIDDVILEYTDTADRIGDGSEENYLIEGQLVLPNFEDENQPALLARVHCLVPPVVPEAKVTIAKKNRNVLTLEEMVASNSVSQQMAQFLIALARGRVTTVFSGLSGSGKTTLIESLSYYFDANDRIIVVEDTPELRLPQTDVVYLHSTPVKPGSDPSKAVSLEWLVSSTNRMRPDRIIVGEVRGGEMAEFLIAANSGADGSMTTMHASTPKLTLDKMISLTMKSGNSKSETSVARDIASTVQIIVQMALIEGRHIITHIEEVTRVVRKETGGIVTQTLFAYDRDRDTFVPQQRPSAELTSFLAQRGVEIDNSWFRGV